MSILDFSGLTDDQLVELARACCKEAVRRSPAAYAAVERMMLDEAEKLRVAQTATAAEAAAARARERERIANEPRPLNEPARRLHLPEIGPPPPSLRISARRRLGADECRPKWTWSAASLRKLSVEAVADVIAENRYRLVTFSNSAAECDPAAISEPEGGTRLDLGLGAVARLQPRATLVISDGRPDNADLALASAETVTGVIHVLYVGPDSDADAIAFMDLLARRGAGRYRHADIRDRDAVLQKEIRLMLGWQP